MDKYPLITKLTLGFLVTMLVIIGLQAWHPWQRQPVVFYEPLILPIETIKGDVIMFSDGSYIVSDRNKRINALKHNGEKVVIKSTIHVSLWELLTNEHFGFEGYKP